MTWRSIGAHSSGGAREMAGERDVLAEQIGAVIDRWYHLGLLRFNCRDDGSDDLILRDELVAATLATLSKSAPDLEACIGDPSHQYHSHDDDPLAATPPAEPLPREALDDDGLCAECGHDDNEHVHYCAHETTAGSCYCNVEYVALSPDRPTPP